MSKQADYQQQFVGLEKRKGFTPVLLTQNIHTLKPYWNKDTVETVEGFRENRPVNIKENCCGGMSNDMYFGSNYNRTRENYGCEGNPNSKYNNFNANNPYNSGCQEAEGMPIATYFGSDYNTRVPLSVSEGTGIPFSVRKGTRIPLNVNEGFTRGYTAVLSPKHQAQSLQAKGAQMPFIKQTVKYNPSNLIIYSPPMEYSSVRGNANAPLAASLVIW